MTWLGLEWNKPSRADWYMMALRAELRRVHSKAGTDINLSDFKLPFDLTASEKKEDPRKLTLMSQTRWLAGASGPVTVIKGTRRDPVTGQALA